MPSPLSPRLRLPLETRAPGAAIRDDAQIREISGDYSTYTGVASVNLDFVIFQDSTCSNASHLVTRVSSQMIARRSGIQSSVYLCIFTIKTTQASWMFDLNWRSNASASKSPLASDNENNFFVSLRRNALPSEETRKVVVIVDQTLHNERGFNLKTNIWHTEGGRTAIWSSLQFEGTRQMLWLRHCFNCCAVHGCPLASRSDIYDLTAAGDPQTPPPTLQT